MPEKNKLDLEKCVRGEGLPPPIERLIQREFGLVTDAYEQFPPLVIIKKIANGKYQPYFSFSHTPNFTSARIGTAIEVTIGAELCKHLDKLTNKEEALVAALNKERTVYELYICNI